MPKLRIKTVIEYEGEFESPEDAVRLAYDGELNHHQGVHDVEAYVEAVYAEDNVTRVWPKDKRL
jgi:hypothetical protein